MRSLEAQFQLGIFTKGLTHLSLLFDSSAFICEIDNVLVKHGAELDDIGVALCQRLVNGVSALRDCVEQRGIDNQVLRWTRHLVFVNQVVHGLHSLSFFLQRLDLDETKDIF